MAEHSPAVGSFISALKKSEWSHSRTGLKILKNLAEAQIGFSGIIDDRAFVAQLGVNILSMIMPGMKSVEAALWATLGEESAGAEWPAIAAEEWVEWASEVSRKTGNEIYFMIVANTALQILKGAECRAASPTFIGRNGSSALRGEAFQTTGPSARRA